MTGEEFIAKARKHGKRRGKIVGFSPSKGKGSHGTLYVGARRTTVKDRKREIGKGLLARMLKDLGLGRDDF